MTLLPLAIVPEISKLSTAWLFFFANFITTSGVELRDGGFAAERNAKRSASGEIDSVISLFALD
jgi:hypothetical protein